MGKHADEHDPAHFLCCSLNPIEETAVSLKDV